MSASKQKKIRQEQREQGTEKRQLAQQKAEKTAKRVSRIKVTVWVVVLAIVAVALLVSSGLFYNHFTALKVGDEKYTAAEYNFFYKSYISNFVNQYGQYLSYMGLDTTKPYDEQTYEDGKTWADFFKESTQTQIKEVTALYAEAEKEGFKLNADDQKSLDETLESLKTSYKTSDYPSANAYLASLYGKGCTVEIAGNLITREYIAQSYSTEKNKSFTYTQDDLKAYYEQNKDDLDSFKYISYFASGEAKTGSSSSGASSATDVSASASDVSTSPAASQEATSTDVSPAASASPSTADLMAEAKEKADTVAAAKTAEAFKAAAKEVSGSEVSDSTTQGKSLSKDYASWLKDASRKEGDITVIKTDKGYYALYFISRETNDYSTVNVRHILFKVTADSNGKYTDEAKAAAKEKAEAELKKWKDGDATENSFAELAKADTEDTGSKENGGLYENVYKGQMVTDFNDWIFDTARKPGDTGIVYGEVAGSYAGYHVMYYVGQGELYRYKLAEDAKRNADFTAWKDALLKNYTLTEGWTAKLVK